MHSNDLGYPAQPSTGNDNIRYRLLHIQFRSRFTSANRAFYVRAGGTGCMNYVGFEGTLEINGQLCTYAGGTLPLELLDFSASKNGNSVELKWQTTDELLVRDFRIERASADFDWQVISVVDIDRSSTARAKTYFFTDKNPVQGENYYRLKISDYDGYSEYSKLVSIDFKGESKNIILYPNPVKDMLYISNENTSEIISIELYNSHGKKNAGIPGFIGFYRCFRLINRHFYGCDNPE